MSNPGSTRIARPTDCAATRQSHGHGCRTPTRASARRFFGKRGAVTVERKEWPLLSTVDEVAALLRTSKKAVYVSASRGLVPGATKVGRRLLFRTVTLLKWLDQQSAPSLKE